MASGFNITDASVSNLAKRKYAKASLNMYNGQIPTLGLIKKTFDNVGERIERPIPTGFAGGASFNHLSIANRGVYEKAYFGTIPVYTVAEINRKTIKAFKDEGAFVDGIKETMKKTVEKFNWVMNYTVNGPGDGSFGTIDSVTANGGGSYSVVITAASWVKARWEIREIVNVGTGDTSQFEITAITRSTRTVTIVRRSGSKVPVATDVVYLDGSYDGAPQGAIGVLSATSGTKYGIPIADRWQAAQINASGAGISADLLTQLVLETWENVGLFPTHLTTSVLQIRKLMATIEDLKRYSLTPTELSPRAKELVGRISYSGVEFMTPSGAIPILVDRQLPDTVVAAWNMNECEIAHNDQGWFDDEGFIFLRKEGADAYEARYGGYLDNYIPPTTCGYLYGLAS